VGQRFRRREPLLLSVTKAALLPASREQAAPTLRLPITLTSDDVPGFEHVVARTIEFG